MSVTIPTAPFDLGNGQHGVIVEPKDACGHNAPCSYPNARVNDCCYTQPPQWVLDALEPCAACTGDLASLPVDYDCHAGKPVVELQVPTPGWGHDAIGHGIDPGVSAGQWTVTEALPIVGEDHDPDIDHCIVIWDDGLVSLHQGETWCYIDLPGDPADLIGKFLVIVEAVA